MSQFAAGTHLVVFCGGYFHHGLSVGNDEVIHYGKDGLTDGCRVCYTSLDDFADGRDVMVINHPNPTFGPGRSIVRACSRLGEQEYSLTSNNCEHFVYWCIEGKKRSHQVRAAAGAATGAAATVGYRSVMANAGEQVTARVMRSAVPGVRTALSSLSGAKTAAAAFAPASSMVASKGVALAVGGGAAGAGTSALLAGGGSTAAGLVGGSALASGMVAAVPVVAVATVGALVWSLWDD